MKLRSITFFLLLYMAVSGFISCQKSASDVGYGLSYIYMPQAINQSAGINNNFNVPAGTDTSTYNYQVDTVNAKLDVLLGVYLAGPESGAYTVTVQTNSDTIQQLISTQVLDATTILMPASMYTLPTSVNVNAGARGNTFQLAIDIAQLKQSQYAGKNLALAVKVANPTKYALNSSLSTTIIVINVNTMVIGPANEITSTYIKNPGSPFVASSMDGGGRWGTLALWTENAAARSHNGNGGFCNDGDGLTMDMESGWGSPQIYNGKIYQTINLPAGSYSFTPAPWVWQGTLDPTYVVVAPGLDSLPDYSNIIGNNAITSANLSVGTVSFTLSTPSKVSIGIVVNYIQAGQGFKTHAVHLYNYPKHL